MIRRHTPGCKKIAYLTLQSTREGTASHAHVHEIVSGLKRLGWQVNLFGPRYSQNHQKPGIVRRLIEFAFVQLRYLLSSATAVDAIYLRSHFALLPVALFAKIAGIPVLQEVNGPYEDIFSVWPHARKFELIIKFMIKAQYTIADAIITVTPGLKVWVRREVGHNAVFVIPNGANADLFHPDADSPLKCPQSYAVFFGALSVWQGIDSLMEAFQLENWPTDLKLVVVGDGQERQRIENICQKDRRVVYLGRVAYRQLPGIISNSEFGIIPKSGRYGHSTSGLFPLKLFETLACGVPVIVTNLAGQADFVREHHCGIVIQPDNPQQLASAVAQLHSNPDEIEKMGAKGRNAIVTGHSWAVRADATNAIIEKTLSRARRR